MRPGEGLADQQHMLSEDVGPDQFPSIWAPATPHVISFTLVDRCVGRAGRFSGQSLCLPVTKRETFVSLGSRRSPLGQHTGVTAGLPRVPRPLREGERGPMKPTVCLLYLESKHQE